MCVCVEDIDLEFWRKSKSKELRSHHRNIDSSIEGSSSSLESSKSRRACGTISKINTHTLTTIAKEWVFLFISELIFVTFLININTFLSIGMTLWNRCGPNHVKIICVTYLLLHSNICIFPSCYNIAILFNYVTIIFN